MDLEPQIVKLFEIIGHLYVENYLYEERVTLLQRQIDRSNNENVVAEE